MGNGGIFDSGERGSVFIGISSMMEGVSSFILCLVF